LDGDTLSVVTAVFLDYDDAAALAKEGGYLLELSQSIALGDELIAELTDGNKHIEWILCIDNAPMSDELLATNPALAWAFERADAVCYTGAPRSGAARGRNACFERVSGRWMYPIDGDDHLLASDGIIERIAAIVGDAGLGRYGFIGATQDLLFASEAGSRLVPGAQSWGTVPYRDETIELLAQENDLVSIWRVLGFSPFNTGNIIWNVERLEELRGPAPWNPDEVSENTEMILEYSQHIDGLFMPGLRAKGYRCDERPTVTTSADYLAKRDDQQRDLGRRLGVEVGGVPTIGGTSITKTSLERIEQDVEGHRVLEQLRAWARSRHK
jgi:hypothetical protein